VNQRGRPAVSNVNRPRAFAQVKDNSIIDLPDGGPEFTSAGMKWSDVPEHARYQAAWIDGRHGPTRAPLPTIEIEPIPAILNQLPRLHDDRPRGSKAMLDAGGASARLRSARPGAWLLSPYTGWKWAVWPDGEVGWVPAKVGLPFSLRVSARNDIQ
jgi:hypothetical protein